MQPIPSTGQPFTSLSPSFYSLKNLPGPSLVHSVKSCDANRYFLFFFRISSRYSIETRGKVHTCSPPGQGIPPLDLFPTILIPFHPPFFIVIIITSCTCSHLTFSIFLPSFPLFKSLVHARDERNREGCTRKDSSSFPITPLFSLFPLSLEKDKFCRFQILSHPSYQIE